MKHALNHALQALPLTFSAAARRSVLGALLGIAALSLGACSKPQESAAPATTAAPISPAQAYEVLAQEGKGFTVGSLMSAHTVYVLFDPQCPHCGHLWQQSTPLQTKAKFVWMPVAFINAKSAPQGAALLAAANPAEAMALHEASLLAGSGGTSASASVPDDIAASIKKNTELFNRLGGESVPFIVAKKPNSDQVVTHAGAMDTAALQAFLGIN